MALQHPGDDEPRRKKTGKRDQSQKRDVVASNVKQRPLEKPQIHVF